MRGNHRLLLDVVNRRNPTALWLFNQIPLMSASAADPQPGNGFLMRQGYTVAWCGWQHDMAGGPQELVPSTE